MPFYLKRYIKKKKIITNFFFKKNKYKKYKNTKLNFKEIFFLKKKINFFKYDKKNFQLIYLNRYNFYTSSMPFFKKNFITLKYEKLINLIKIKKIINLNYIDKNLIIKNKFIVLNNFVIIYNFFLNSIFIDLFYFTKLLKNKNRTIFFLILSFKQKKLFINLQNKKKKNYLSISTGFFIKFFEKRKSLKKNKAIKLLMIKYLRKLFIITKINNLILLVKKTPFFINELINFINNPIAHKYINPIDNKIVDESLNKNLSIRFFYFIFTENKNFSKNKNPSKGRIKRKILRKVIFENKIID